MKLWPSIKKLGRNSYGTYFYRLIKYPNVVKGSEDNQLEYVISTRERGNGRRSAYQCLIYAPIDATDQKQRGFPCLQSLTFSIADQALTLNAFYPKQDLISRGYGNLLGLCNLGRFVAHEMQLPFNQIAIFAGIASLGGFKASQLVGIRKVLQQEIGLDEE